MLFRISVDESRPALTVHDLLTRVEAVVAGQHITYAKRNRKENEPAAPEELDREDDRGDGAVDYSAEQRHQPDRRAEGRRQSQEGREGRAHRRA